MNIEIAQYRDEDLKDFRYNPLIEALPAPLEPEDAINRLMIRPDYDDSERHLSVSRRMLLTQNLARLHQPLAREVDVFIAIDRCLRWGYVDRNPLEAQYTAQLAAGYKAYDLGKPLHTAGGYHPHTYGFSVLGISGIGKSTTVEAILSYYTQLIRHRQYRNVPMSFTQVTWVKLDCTPDGSLKGLCLSFFKELDRLLGTSYVNQYQRNYTLDAMILAMARLTEIYNVGLIVLDELQNLCTASESVPKKVLNFFVTLVNTIGVPVLMIGSPLALSILQKDFQQARRGSGQGDALWERMQNDADWDIFCQAIWQYQYTKSIIPYSPAMRNALYAEALGIPFLAVHIYKLVQEYAILSGSETFTPKDFQRIATKKMGLTKPMRDAMRAGKDVDLQQFMDITPFSLKDYKDNYSVTAEAKSPIESTSRPKINLQDVATQTLLDLGLPYSTASSCVSWAIAKSKNCTVASSIARDAYDYYLRKPDNSAKEKAPLQELAGYDALNKAGYIES